MTIKTGCLLGDRKKESKEPREQPPSKPGFLSLGTIDLGAGESHRKEAVLCIAGV